MRRHPWLTAAVVLFVLLLLCVAAFFVFEWRSEKRWQHYAAEARLGGVKMSITDFAPPVIPDGANFAKLPMWQKVFADPQAEAPFDLPSKRDAKQLALGGFSFTPDSVPQFGNALKSQPINWQEWQQYFADVGYLTGKSDDPIRDVLRSLEHYAPEFRQWQEWHTRKECRFPINWSKTLDTPVPQLGVTQKAARIFALQMRAHLALHDSAAAYADLRDGLQAYRALRREPTLIDGLVRISVVKVVLAAVGDGCKEHAWSDEDCRKIETDLGGIRVWDDWSLALASERGQFNHTVETWLGASQRERAEMFATAVKLSFGESTPAEARLAGWYPRALIRDNQLRENRYFDELLTRIDTEKQTLDPDLMGSLQTALPVNRVAWFHYFLFFTTRGVYAELEHRYIGLQTALDQTRLACALERFQAKRGTYPAALSELAPDFLAAVPNDIYAKAPYHYRRIGETTFQLYGVGKNRKDDGGLIAPRLPENQQLDAIWLYAPPAASPY